MGKQSRRLARRTRTEPWPVCPKRPATLGYVAGWCTDDEPSRQEAMRYTEDLLRWALGEDLAGPVRWHLADGLKARLLLARRGRETYDPTLRSYLKELAEMLDRRGGLIVVASATSSDPHSASVAQSRALREGMRRAKQGV